MVNADIQNNPFRSPKIKSPQVVKPTNKYNKQPIVPSLSDIILELGLITNAIFVI